MGKRYYVAVETCYNDGKVIRSFVNGRAFGAMYSFTQNINDAKFFDSLKAAKDYMKNYIGPTRSKVFYEIMYDCV